LDRVVEKYKEIVVRILTIGINLVICQAGGKYRKLDCAYVKHWLLFTYL